MSRSLSRPAPRSWRSQLLAGVVILLGTASSAFAQSPGCQVTSTAPTWIGGNGFGASIDIRNTGPAINGWSLVFNMPNGQRMQNGWPVTFTQPAGSAVVTVASNAAWNATTRDQHAFQRRVQRHVHSGANNPPAQFTLNGTVCRAAATPRRPCRSRAHERAGQSAECDGSFNATASDAGGAVSRVEFRLDTARCDERYHVPVRHHVQRERPGRGHAHRAGDGVRQRQPSLSASHTVTFTVQGGGQHAADRRPVGADERAGIPRGHDERESSPRRRPTQRRGATRRVPRRHDTRGRPTRLALLGDRHRARRGSVHGDRDRIRQRRCHAGAERGDQRCRSRSRVVGALDLGDADVVSLPGGTGGHFDDPSSAPRLRPSVTVPIARTSGAP